MSDRGHQKTNALDDAEPLGVSRRCIAAYVGQTSGINPMWLIFNYMRLNNQPHGLII